MSHRNNWRGLGCLASVVALCACTDETVNLGGGRVSQPLEGGARCADAVVVPDSVRVSDQEELEALAGCEEIGGDLRVQVFDGADLSPLASLRRIGGVLALGAKPPFGRDTDPALIELSEAEYARIFADGYLPSLAGLDALERVAGLDFIGIAAEDLAPLLSLRELVGLGRAGFVSITGTDLRSLRGLENVVGVSNLGVFSNAELASLGGMVLETAVARVSVTGSPQLRSLSELSSTVAIDSLDLSDLGITDLDDLASLEAIDSLYLSDNGSLVNVDRLAEVNVRHLQIYDNPVLQSVPALVEMTALETFLAVDNPELRTIGLDLPVRSAGGDALQGERLIDPVKVIDIGRNETLESVSLAAGLEQARFLAIYENPALTRISLGTLTSAEEVRIAENPTLDSVDLGALQTVQSLAVIGNPSLDTAGLAALRTFETTLEGNAGEPANGP